MQSSPPNVVLIVTDDQGPWALGAAGNDEISTPTLDRLAADGLRLSRFFCVSPVCSPARASLYTGQIPSQHGVHDWLSAGHVGPAAIDHLAGRPLFTDALARAGYRCGLVGKWHLGANDRPRPGFVHWFAHQLGGGPYYDAPVVRDGELTTQPGYLTDALAADACAFVRREAARPEPFFLAVQFTAPHSPWLDNHPAELTDLYRDCAFDSCPQPDPHPWARLDVHGRQTQCDGDVRGSLIGYFAAVSGVDRAVARVLHALDAAGVREQTLVVFTSDNGFNCGHHGVWGKGNGTVPQNMYDTSVLVPFIANHPHRIPAGRVSAQMVSGYDFAPTLLDYLGVDYQPPQDAPGRSFAALLRDAPASADSPGQREHVVVFDEYGPARMIRTPAAKYVYRHPNGPHEFYDLSVDPGEEHNLVGDPARRSTVRELHGELSAWFAAHVEHANDGIRLPVSGYGQRNRAREPHAFVAADGS